jgi:hypothetical protein
MLMFEHIRASEVHEIFLHFLAFSGLCFRRLRCSFLHGKRLSSCQSFLARLFNFPVTLVQPCIGLAILGRFKGPDREQGESLKILAGS